MNIYMKRVLPLVLAFLLVFGGSINTLFSAQAAGFNDSGVVDSGVTDSGDPDPTPDPTPPGPQDSGDPIPPPTTATMSGTLTFADGSLAPYRTLVISSSATSITLNSDYKGAFSAANMAPATYNITSTSYYSGSDDLNTSKTIAVGDTSVVWNLKYPAIAANGTITFQFNDSEGKAAQGVQVSMYSFNPNYTRYSGVTDPSGRVVFSHLGLTSMGIPYCYSYSAGSGQHGDGNLQLSTSSPSATISKNLPAVRTISGRIATTSGIGISSAYVSASGGSSWLSGYTDALGNYALRGAYSNTSYTVCPSVGSKYMVIGGANRTVQVSTDNLTGIDFKVTEGVTVTGNVTLDGRTDNFSKAYVQLRTKNGAYVNEGYASSTAGFGFDGAIKEAGDYRLSIYYLYDKNGWYTTDYEATPVQFTVTEAMLAQPRLTYDLPVFTKMKTNAAFQGSGNSLTSNRKVVQMGEKFDFTGKFQNNSKQTITATFNTTLTNATVQTGVKPEFAETSKTVTLKPGESGRFYILAKAGEKNETVSALTKVTINGRAYDFAQVSVDMATVTLMTATCNVKPNTPFTVYGEVLPGSNIRIINVGDGMKIGSILLVPDQGKYYSIELAGFDKVGTYQIVAEANSDRAIVTSDILTIRVDGNPIEVNTVQIDGSSYQDLPKNSRTGIRTFNHSVDGSLRPFPMKVRSTFTNDQAIKSVVYHFAGSSFPAQKDSANKWYADASTWRGTGIQRLTATITTTDGRTIDMLLAEATVLVDPSGYITDADTGDVIAGALVECLQRTADNSWVRLDTDAIAQPANPWITGEIGYYGWDVPNGTYKVVASKDGYETNTSDSIDKYKDGIEIPPPALDVDIAMIPTVAMKLTSLTSAVGGIEAKFSRYLKEATVSVTDPQGKNIVVTATIRGNTIIITGDALKDGITYTVTFTKVTPKTGKAAEYTLASESKTVVFSSVGEINIHAEFGAGLDDLIRRDQRQLISAKGSVPPGTVLKISAASEQPIPSDIQLEPDAKPIFLELSLKSNSTQITLDGNIQITLPIMQGLDANKPILIIHYNADGTVKEIIKATINANSTFSFTVRSLSPFGFVNGSVKKDTDTIVQRTSNTSSSSATKNARFFNNKMYLLNEDIVYSTSLDEISGKDELYTVYFQNEEYTFNGKNIGKAPDGVIYFGALDFVKYISKFTSTKAGEVTAYNPETGGVNANFSNAKPPLIVEDTVALAPSVSKIDTDTNIPLISNITPQPAIEQTTAPDTATTSGIWLVIISLAVLTGLSTWYYYKKTFK